MRDRTSTYRVQIEFKTRQDTLLWISFTYCFTITYYICITYYILNKSIHELLITFLYITFTFIITLFYSFFFCLNHPFYYLTLFVYVSFCICVFNYVTFIHFFCKFHYMIYMLIFTCLCLHRHRLCLRILFSCTPFAQFSLFYLYTYIYLFIPFSIYYLAQLI